MQLRELLSKFTSFQIKGLTSVMMIAFKIFVTAIFTIFVAATEAQAAPPPPVVESAPEPESADLQNISGQGIEGLKNILDNGALNLSDNSKVTISRDLPNTVTIGDGNLLEIAQAALDVWLTAFPKLKNLDIKYGVGSANFEIYCQSIRELAFPNVILTDLAAFYIHADGDDDLLPANFPDANNFIPGSDLKGVILLNSQEDLVLSNGGKILYYLDPDPLDQDPQKHSIFDSVASFVEREKNGINYGRSKFVDSENDPFSSLGANPGDLVIDFFSVALHEIQHALGLTGFNPKATNTGKLVDTANPGISNFTGNRDLQINLPEFSGTIPTTFNETDDSPSLHLNDDLDYSDDTNFNFEDLENDLGLLPPGYRVEKIKNDQIPTPVALDIVTDRERKCPSAADVLAIAEINGYTNYDTNPCETLAQQKVPEPSTIVFLISLGVYGSLQLRRNQFKPQ